MRSDLLTLAYGSYCGELVSRIQQDVDSHRIYALLISLLQALDSLGCSGQELDTMRAALSFQCQLLESLGVYPLLDGCLRCATLVPSQPDVWFFSAEQGGLFCPRCQYSGAPATLTPISVSTLQVLNQAQAGDWKALVKTQRFLKFYTTHLLDVELRSAAFLRQTIETLTMEQGALPVFVPRPDSAIEIEMG
jgi:DNA repair protein RecO